jgi:predicted RNase H-like HicB family nuclease
MKPNVQVMKTGDGYTVWCPGLPGFWSRAATEEEALDMMRGEIERYLQTVESLKRESRAKSVFDHMN